jgi:serine/threonine protein kinase
MSVEHVHALAKGERLNQYELLNILGAGGFGITYMARDTTLDTMVAIKEYLPGDLAVRQGDSKVTAKSSTSKGDFDWGLSRFLEEARVLAKFRHPNIVRVNQIFEANNTAYLVMDYAKGESLADLLRRAAPLNEQQTKDILFPILDGLKRVHEQGFLHRDIKPANIIIRDEGGAVLIDFGAARQAIETKSRAITSIVTEGYAPLEQYDAGGNQGPWTDIYALGAVAYTCLTGNKPASATSRVRNDSLVPLAIAAKYPVSKNFAAAIESALHVYENERPQTIDEFAALISGAIPLPATSAQAADATQVLNADATRVTRPVSAALSVPAPQSAPIPESTKRVSPVYLGAAAAVLLVIAVGGWFAVRGVPGSQIAVKEPAGSYAPAGQLTVPNPAVPQIVAPTEQSPTRPNVAPGSPVPALPPPAPARPTERDTASPSPPPVVPPAGVPAPIERPPSIRNDLAATPSVALRPSFDCAKATNDAESIVCSDNQLAGLDVKMADLYRRGLSSVTDSNVFSGEQQIWLSQRDDCTDRQCLVVSYNDRIKELERWVGR